MTDQITVWGKQTSSQITLTQTGFSQSQTETAQDAEGAQRPEGHSGQESSWLLGQGEPEQGPKGWGGAGRVMRKAHGTGGAAVQRPCGGRRAECVQEVGYQAAGEQSRQRGYWAGKGDTMHVREGRLDFSQGFQFMSVSHTDGKKGKEGLPLTLCKKWVVLTSLFSFFFFFFTCPNILK